MSSHWSELVVLCLTLTGYLRFLTLQAPSKAVRPTPVLYLVSTLYEEEVHGQLPGVAAARALASAVPIGRHVPRLI